MGGGAKHTRLQQGALPQQNGATIRDSSNNHNNSSYYGRLQRPEHACFIDFKFQSASTIEHLVRALDFGPSDANPLGTPRLVVGDVIICPTVASVAQHKGEASTGSVVSCDEDSITIKTCDGFIRFVV